MRDKIASVAYVILNYGNPKDTIECINSLLANETGTNVFFVIVDNSSGKDVEAELLTVVSQDKRIHLLINPENLGYAKGNNAGIVYARKSLNAEFVIVLNNDTILRQTDFSNIIVHRFHKDPYAILGPDILTMDGINHQNPPKRYYKDLRSLRQYIFNMQILWIASLINADQLVKGAKFILTSILGKRNSSETILYEQLEAEDTILHGSCLVFSPLFFLKFDGFYPETFLFGEEEILFLQSKVFDLKTVYYPNAVIYHKEDGTLDSIFLKKSRAKREFIYANKIKSAKILKRLLKKGFPEDYLLTLQTEIILNGGG